MSMLRAAHDRLIGIPWWRRHQRRLSRWVKRAAGSPDAYGDMFAIARAIRPAAILDIGSYIGDTIERFLDELSIPIYGFEPTPDSFLKLERRFGGNPQVRVFNCALANREGEESLFCNENPQTNSLLDNDAGNVRSFFDETKHVGATRVKVRTLDAWASGNLPSGGLLVKADVQGAEGRLLDGGDATFRNRVMAFYAEAQLCPMYKCQTAFFELNERLTKDYGFCLHNVYPCLHDKYGRAVQIDALWIKESVLLQPDGQSGGRVC
jgi:FkbM family methyltransferase